VIPFSSPNRRREIASIEIPNHCGNGHALTPENIRIDQRERRWRCRECGRERAAAFSNAAENGCLSFRARGKG
jgi:hypothetical protein